MVTAVPSSLQAPCDHHHIKCISISTMLRGLLLEKHNVDFFLNLYVRIAEPSHSHSRVNAETIWQNFSR